MIQLSTKNKISRLNIVKRNLETKNFTNLEIAATPLRRDAKAIAVLLESGLVEKREDGFYYWIGGPVNKELAEKFFKNVNEKRRKYYRLYKKNNSPLNQNDEAQIENNVIGSVNSRLNNPEEVPTEGKDKIMMVVHDLSKKIDVLSERVFNPVLKKTYEQDTLRTMNRIADIQTDLSYAVKKMNELFRAIEEKHVS